jgi:hypothetical protein
MQGQTVMNSRFISRVWYSFLFYFRNNEARNRGDFSGRIDRVARLDGAARPTSFHALAVEAKTGPGRSRRG